ncbi:uncharacterized protein [Petaurus breviceps papuanus]|uniref:uncharacterized protein n=1 Tax=Petaurus breviceps papuanus TaxID=3040969 RepID=UPI0036DA3846
MSPTSRNAPPTLGLLGLLPLPLLLLLISLPAAQGACSIPPDIPNAKPELNGLTSFPVDSTVTYKCNEGFVKIPGKSDSVVCLQPNKWSKLSEFCNRTCNVPPSLRFASLKKQFSKQNYFPVDFTVQYECRPGYKRDNSLPAKLTCLQNLMWSRASEFCKRKSCPSPPELLHGHVSVETDILYGSTITFTCDKGYRLVGAQESLCILKDKNVVWSDSHPECTAEKSATTNVPATQAPPTTKQASATNAPAKQAPPSEQASATNVPAKQAPPTEQASATNAPATQALPPEQASATNTPATQAPPPGQASVINVPAKQAPPSEQASATNTPAKQAPPRGQASATNAPATQAPPPGQASVINVPAKQAPPSEQASATNAPATQALPPEQASATNAPATQAPPPEQASVINVPAKQAPPLEQASATNTPATQALPPGQASATNAPATQAPPAGQASATNAPATQAPSSQEASVTSTPAKQTNATNTPATEALVVELADPALALPITEQAEATNAPAKQTQPPTHQASTTNAATTSTTLTTKRSSTTRSSTRIVTTLRSTTAASFHTTRPSSTKLRGKGTTSSGAVTTMHGISGGLIALAVLIVLPVFIKLLCNSGKSGKYMYNIGTADYEAINDWLTNSKKRRAKEDNSFAQTLSSFTRALMRSGCNFHHYHPPFRRWNFLIGLGIWMKEAMYAPQQKLNHDLALDGKPVRLALIQSLHKLLWLAFKAPPHPAPDATSACIMAAFLARATPLEGTSPGWPWKGVAVHRDRVEVEGAARCGHLPGTAQQRTQGTETSRGRGVHPAPPPRAAASSGSGPAPIATKVALASALTPAAGWKKGRREEKNLEESQNLVQTTSELPLHLCVWFCFFSVIRCHPPPDVVNGQHTEAFQDYFTYGSSVRYTCDKTYSLIGDEYIHCTTNNMKDGEWSGPPPQCKVVRCENPIIQNGHLLSGRRPHYTYKETVILECSSGFYMEGEEKISCGADNSWVPSVPQCIPGVKSTTVRTTTTSTSTTTSTTTTTTTTARSPSSASEKENQLDTIILVIALIIFTQI